MPEKSHDRINFEGLQKFLTSIGFEKAAHVNRSLAFHHRDSGTIVTLIIPDDGQEVRPADLLSILVRLENQGLVEESMLQQFRIGKLPLAS
jgi:hypothetical protein